MSNFCFLTPAEQYLFISATMVKGNRLLGAIVSKFCSRAWRALFAAKVGKDRVSRCLTFFSGGRAEVA